MATAAAAKEKTFTWEGTDRKGNRIKGVSTGAAEAQVRAQLRKQGINPLRVRQKSELFGKRGKKITTMDIAIFSRQLAVMMQAGVPLVQALGIVGSGHENPSMGELINQIRVSIEGGSTLAESLGKHPLYFDDLFVNLVEAGEKSGALEALLDKVATYKEKTEAIKAKVKKALTYPTAVLAIAFIVSGILLVFVVPQFQTLFQDFGADLPAFTQMVINMSVFMQAYWFVIMIGIAGTGAAFVQGKKRSPAFRRLLDRVMLRLPIIGDILNKSAVARFARTLSTMFAAGVPLVDALESVAKASGNIIYEEAIMQMREQVSTGTQLQLAMQSANLFPAMAQQMVAIGEESGSLDAMCAKVADFYEAEVDNLVDNLSSLMEPMIMAVLGVMVGGLVTAMYLPIFKLGQVV